MSFAKRIDFIVKSPLNTLRQSQLLFTSTRQAENILRSESPDQLKSSITLNASLDIYDFFSVCWNQFKFFIFNFEIIDIIRWPFSFIVFWSPALWNRHLQTLTLAVKKKKKLVASIPLCYFINVNCKHIFSVIIVHKQTVCPYCDSLARSVPLSAH